MSDCHRQTEAVCVMVLDHMILGCLHKALQAVCNTEMLTRPHRNKLILSGLYAWTYSLYTRGIVKGLEGVSGSADG